MNTSYIYQIVYIRIYTWNIKTGSIRIQQVEPSSILVLTSVAGGWINPHSECATKKVTHHRFTLSLTAQLQSKICMRNGHVWPVPTPFFSECFVSSHLIAVNRSSVERKPGIPCLVLEAPQVIRQSKNQKHFRHLVWGRASSWNLSVVPAASIVWLQLQSLVISNLCSEIVTMTLSAMSTMSMPAMSDFVACLVLLCWGSGNCLFTLARVCQGGSELIPDLNFCCFDLFRRTLQRIRKKRYGALRQQQCDHLDAVDMLLQEPFQEPQSHEQCSMKSSSTINLMWNSVPFAKNVLTQATQVYELSTILQTSTHHLPVSYSIMQHPTWKTIFKKYHIVCSFSLHSSLNRRVEISSSWNQAEEQVEC